MRLIALLPLLVSVACATVPTPTGSTSQETAPVTQTTVSTVSAEAERLDAIFEQYFEERLRINPLIATSIGDDRYNNIFPVGIAEEARTRDKATYERFLGQLDGVDAAQLDEQRRLSHAMLKRELQTRIEGFRHPSHLIPLNQFYSTPSYFAQLGSGASIHRFRTTKDYDDFLGRIDGFERWIDTAIANMRRGMAAGFIQPRALMEKTVPQIEAHIVDDPDQSIFFRPLQSFPESVSTADRERLNAAYRAAIKDRIVPAYRKIRDFVRDEYLPAARATAGLGVLPNGDAWYRYNVASITTTRLTPEEIHEIGLSEVERIHREMNAIKDQVGFSGDLKAFFKHLQTDPKFLFASREDLLQSYRAEKRRIDSTILRLFDAMPHADFEIQPVEPFRERSASGGQYSAATPDGSRPGVFYVNTYDLSARPRYDMTALTLHEGNPGHHFQISIQRELTTVPKFRRFGGYTAYSEGWGLYAETLGYELGVYDDPYSRYGQLSGELWRSIRLVTDTGMHAKGWTREQAIQYAIDNSSLGNTRIVSEIERFMAIPGQALAYKVGQLEIQRLRSKAEKALGPKFGVKAFHRAVLGSGAMPLDLLEEQVDRWIASGGA